MVKAAPGLVGKPLHAAHSLWTIFPESFFRFSECIPGEYPTCGMRAQPHLGICQPVMEADPLLEAVQPEADHFQEFLHSDFWRQTYVHESSRGVIFIVHHGGQSEEIQGLPSHSSSTTVSL